MQPTILTPDQRLRVFVSSTLQELAEERKAAKAAVLDLRLSPVMFELGARPHPPRSLYRAYLEQSHIFVGIYWQRYGWVAPGEEISGLEDEYRLAGDRPKLIYVKAPAPEREDRLKTLLKQIQSDDQASYKPFATAKELRELLQNDLALLLTERFAASLQPAEASLAPAQNTVPRGTLPLPPTPLIGREQEVDEVSALLVDEGVRLVTLLGPGGVGKSRLGLEVGSRLQHEFRDGVRFVPLASVTDPALVVPSIAGVLGVREGGGAALLEQLKGYLQNKKTLLLLDNFEQLEAAAPLLSELLSVAPELDLLVTSRSALRLAAEHLYEVPPLSLPERAESPLEAVRATEAVRLFVERARAVRPSFALSADNAQAVAEICRRLDGLPLAIELAAARINLLTPQALLKRLNKRFELLSGGARDLPARQQTLRNTLAWSYDLLDKTDQTLFAWLGVFAGGCTLEAAEGVCGEGVDVFSGLDSLVEQSLVRQTEGEGEPRFTMLESVREYALEKLEASGEAARLRKRHADYFLALAEEAESHFTDAQQALWMDRLDVDHGNLRAALTWAEQYNGELELRLVGSLWRFWYARGHLSEGREWLVKALAQETLPKSVAYAKALHGAGVLADSQSDYASARTLLEQGLALRRDLGDQEGVAASLNSLGLVAEEQGDYALARRLLGESLTLRRELGDTWGVAASLTNLGKLTYDQGDWAAARPLFEEALALFRTQQDSARVAALLTNLGSVLYSQGDYKGARALHEESLAIWRELDDDWGVAITLVNLGSAACGQGDDPSARALYIESLSMFWTLKDKKSAAECLEKLAALDAQEAPERSARLWGAAERSREALAAPLALHERPAYHDKVEAARTRLGEAAFAAAWAEGRKLGLEGAVTLVLAKEV